MTLNPPDHGSYRAPTLRNIEVMAPYMRDGRFKTLDAVLDFYNSQLNKTPYINPLMHHIATRGVQLTSSNKADLKAFLMSLTDHTFLTNPDFANPRPHRTIFYQIVDC